MGEESVSTDSEVQLREAGIIVAHNRDELSSKAKGVPNEFYLITAGADLDDILERWGKQGNWDQVLKGKRVLDLGAGSVNSRYQGRDWTPDFARLCAVNGAQVTAVDINPQGPEDKQLFTEFQADLVEM